MRLFPTAKPLKSIAVDLLGPHPRTKRGHWFVLVIAGRIIEPIQVGPPKRTTCLDVAKAFASKWVPKYGAPK